MTSIRRQALLALPVLAALSPATGAMAQSTGIVTTGAGSVYVPTPVAVAVPYAQAPYNNPYIYNNSGWGASYRAPVQTVQTTLAPSFGNGAALAGTVGSGTWDGVGGSGYSYVAAAQNPGGQATTYGVGNSGPLGNNQAYATNVVNPGGGASLYGMSAQTAAGQTYSTGATFANAYGGGSVSASGAQGAGGSSFGAAAGMSNAFGTGAVTGSGVQSANANNFTTSGTYNGTYGSGSASGNGAQTATGNAWNSAANVSNPGASAGVTANGIYNPAGTNTGYTGNGTLNSNFGTGFSQTSGYANANGSGGYQGATAVLGYGGVVPANWISAGSQLNQGGYYYGGPVNLVYQQPAQNHFYQPTFGYTGGYLPAYQQPYTVVYNPSFVVQQPVQYVQYVNAPLMPNSHYYGPENSGAPSEIGSGI